MRANNGPISPFSFQVAKFVFYPLCRDIIKFLVWTVMQGPIHDLYRCLSLIMVFITTFNKEQSWTCLWGQWP
jgi:hypothetical protein